MDNQQGRVWVELVGSIIVSHIRGASSLDLLEQRYQRILELHRETGYTLLLIDELEMQEMPYEQIRTQQLLNISLDMLGFRIAVLVPDSRMAYLARLQFDQDNYRVFYNDMSGALDWLEPGSSNPNLKVS